MQRQARRVNEVACGAQARVVDAACMSNELRRGLRLRARRQILFRESERPPNPPYSGYASARVSAR